MPCTMPRYRVEIAVPKQQAETLEERLERFARRYRQAIEAGCGVCLTDNAMGHLAFQPHELLDCLQLPGCAQVMVHLNTFHSRDDLDWILAACDRLGIVELLIISGDGAARLPRLSCDDLGLRGPVVTSVELIDFIRRQWGGRFRLGCAFNPYEPAADEWAKLLRKRDAGADFVVTQPMLAPHPAIDRIVEELGLAVVIEAWMSQRVGLLSDCIGYDLEAQLPESGPYQPLDCLRALTEAYPESDFYLALLNLRTQLTALPRLEACA